MQYPPNGFEGGTYSIHNGRPAFGLDALDVDRYATWLAASRKFLVPVPIGTPFDATNTATACPFDLWVPAYSQYVEFVLQCTGRGSVTLTLVGDGFNSVIPVEAFDDAAHAFANAAPAFSGPPQASVLGNGLQRALGCAFQSSWHEAKCTIAVANHASGATLKVWAIYAIIWVPDEAAVLPA